MKQKYYDEHHLIPKSRNGTNAPANRKLAEYNIHHKFHEVFGNLTPHEQIVELLKWNSQVIEKPAFNLVMECIKDVMNKDVFYVQEVIRGYINNRIINPLK